MILDFLVLLELEAHINKLCSEIYYLQYYYVILQVPTEILRKYYGCTTALQTTGGHYGSLQSLQSLQDSWERHMVC